MTTIETEIVEEDFKAPVLKDIEFPITSAELDNLLNEYAEVPKIDPEGENVAEEYQYVLKGHKAFVKARNSIEKVRKELKAPSLDYGKRVDSIAKEFQAKIAQTEQALFIQRKIVEDNEQRKQEAYEQAERDRRDAIRLKIDAIKNLPLDHFNSSTEQLTNVLESLRVATEEEYQEFFEEAKDVLTLTIMQLQTARENKVKTEQAEKIQAENEARLREEQRVKDEAIAKEREEFEQEKAKMQKERDDFEREKREIKETQDLKDAEAEAEKLAEAQKIEKAKRDKINADTLNKNRQDTLDAMDACTNSIDLLGEIIANRIPNLKWEA